MAELAVVVVGEQAPPKTWCRALAAALPPHRLLLALRGQVPDLRRVAASRKALLLDPGCWLVPGWSSEATRAAALDDDAVIVPVSPNVHGPQRIFLEDPALLSGPQGQRAFVRQRAARFAGVLEEIDFLVPLVALAQGGAVAEAVRTGDGTAEGAFRALARDRRILAAAGSVVLATEVKDRLLPGRASDAPLVSLCMIVRDEERLIADALRSAAGLVDEMIVYDTGSRDATREIARREGALVIEGEWRDDFGWARNQVLAHARGRWVLWMDADERLEGDLVGARSRLSSPFVEVEAYSVPIENQLGVGMSASTHMANRIIRRRECHFRGAIHETIWLRDDSRAALARLQPELRLAHLGYLDEEMARKHKAERNIRIASVNESAATPAERALHEARSLTMAGRMDEAIDLVRAEVIGSGEVFLERVAWLGLATWCRMARRYDEAEEAVTAIAASGLDPRFASAAHAELLFDQGRYEEALARIAEVDEFVTDPGGFTVDPRSLIGLRARALAALGRVDGAFSTVLEGLRRGVLGLALAEALTICEDAGREPAELLAALSPTTEPLVVAQLLTLAPEVADLILERLYRSVPGDRVVLAAASLVARRLSPGRAMHWSRRMARCGLGAHAPIGVIARDEERPARERAVAARLASALESIEADLDAMLVDAGPAST